MAKSKHANYKSQSDCNAGAAYTDTCNGNVAMGRMQIWPSRNVGSRFFDPFSSGVLSQNPAKAGDPKRESFYTPSPFLGWHDSSTDNTTPYNNFLMSNVFECYDYTYTFQGTCYWGPGPTPPTVTFLRGHVEGPTSVVTGQSNSWTSFVTGGVRPYLATWTIKYASDSTSTTVGTSTGAGSEFTAGGWTGTITRCENFTLTMTVTDTTGQSWYNNYPVTVTCPPPPPVLSLYINGPGLITTKGTYTYSAVTSGFTSPTYTWSEQFCADSAGASCSGWTTINSSNTYNRVLSPDCSGTGQNTYWTQVTVTNNNGQSLTSQLVTALCQSGGQL